MGKKGSINFIESQKKHGGEGKGKSSYSTKKNPGVRSFKYSQHLEDRERLKGDLF